MNCPKCNKEVSPEWNLCPFCGYKPKKCGNPNHASRWLPQEAKFCPECGEPLDGNGEVMMPPSPPTVPEERRVSVGDILCTDNTTVPVSEWPVAGKFAMGVVFYVDESGRHGWAVSLQDRGNCDWTPEGRETVVLGLSVNHEEVDAVLDMDGYTNTKTIRAAGDTTEYPAAYAVDFTNGWYLPAIGQLKILMNNLHDINKSISVLDGAKLDLVYWSSTQCAENSAWGIFFNGEVDVFYKNSGGDEMRVRGVRTF